jgi:hypothetical protein
MRNFFSQIKLSGFYRSLLISVLAIIIPFGLLLLSGCSEKSSGGGGVQSKVPDSPAIKNSVASADLSASLDTQAEFATQFITSLETALGSAESLASNLADTTSSPVSDSVSGSLSTSIDVSYSMRELVKNQSDLNCRNSLDLLRNTLPLSKALKKVKSSVSKNAMLESQKYLLVTENSLTDSQAVNLSYTLTPDFAAKSSSSISGSFVSGSDQNTYYNAGNSNFDVDFYKFFGALITITTGSENTSSTTESTKLKGNTKSLFTAIKGEKILKYIEESSTSIKISAGGKNLEGIGSGVNSFELNGTNGVFTSLKEGEITVDGKITKVKQSSEVKKIDDSSLSMALSWTKTQEGSNKSYTTTLTLKRNDDKNCTATFNPALSTTDLDELEGASSESQLN